MFLKSYYAKWFTCKGFRGVKKIYWVSDNNPQESQLLQTPWNKSESIEFPIYWGLV